MPDFTAPLIIFIKGYKVIKRDHKAQSVSILIQSKHLFIVQFRYLYIPKEKLAERYLFKKK